MTRFWDAMVNPSVGLRWAGLKLLQFFLLRDRHIREHFQLLLFASVPFMAMEKLKKVTPFRLSSVLRLQKNPNLALQIFQNPNPNLEASQKPFRYSLLSYDIIISKLGRAKMFDEMEKILDQMKLETRFIPKEVIFCNVMAFYGRSRLSEKALHTFEQISSFRCQRTVKSLNSLLNALLNCRQHEKIREIYARIDKYGSPDIWTYNILIHAFCLSDSFDDAWKLFDEMPKKGMIPNAVTFSTLISTLCASSKLDEAFKLKEDMMKKFHVKPTVFVYTSLMKGLCKTNELDLAFKLKEEMLLDRELGLDTAVYTTLVTALFKAGRKGEALGILEEMRESECKPDTVMYNAVISGHCMEKDFESACTVLNEMMEKGCKPDVISYNVIIGGFCKEGRLREAIELFEDMPRRDCVPDVVSYRTLFDGLCNGMELNEAGLILDEMVFKGHAPRLDSVKKFIELSGGGHIDLLSSVLNNLAKGNIFDVDTLKMLISMVPKRVELLTSAEFVGKPSTGP